MGWFSIIFIVLYITMFALEHIKEYKLAIQEKEQALKQLEVTWNAVKLQQKERKILPENIPTREDYRWMEE